MEVSMPVYDPNRGKMNPSELHVVFSETEITVHLHKKYYLSSTWVSGGRGSVELGTTEVSS